MTEFSSLRKTAVLLSCIVIGLLLMLTLGCSSIFSLRHTEGFAVTKLRDKSYTEIHITTVRLVGRNLTYPTETQFTFTAVKAGRATQGTLVCYREYLDLWAGRCVVE